MKRLGLNFKGVAATGMVLALLAGAGRPASGAMIRLKAQTVVEAHQDVRLGDVATVSDSDAQQAEALANTVVLSGVEKDQNLGADSILMALMAQRGMGVLGSDLRMGGAADCRITIGGAAKTVAAAAPMVSTDAVVIRAAPVRAMGEADASTRVPQPGIQVLEQPTSKPLVPPAQNPQMTPPDGQNLTLSQLIVQQVRAGLNGSPENVRVTLETINPLLDAAVPAEQKWLCRPLTRTLLGTVEFEAQLVEGTRILQRVNVQTKVEVRQRVVMSLKRIARGDVVTDGDVGLVDQWLDRSMPKLFTQTGDIVGLEAVRDLDVGSMLDQRDFRPALMAHKNEAVNVIYMSGSLQVQIRGRAMDDGKLHDRIDIRNETTGERYSAVLIGRNLAVAGATLTAEQEKKLQEAQQ